MEKTTTVSKRTMYEALIRYATTGEMTYDTDDGVVAITNEELETFFANEIELLDKKAAKARERAAVKKVEDPLLDAVRNALGTEFESIAEITARVDIADATLSKVIYRLRTLIEEGTAEKQNIKIAGSDGKNRSVVGYRRVAQV